MSKKINQSAMQDLLGGLTSSPAVSSTSDSSTKSSASSEKPRRGRPKRSGDAEQVTMFIDKPLMDKVRALSFQEGFALKDIFTAAVTNFINDYEARYGKLPVARSKSSGIEELLKK